MDESKLLEECVTIDLTPLQTILLSKTLLVTNLLIEFLAVNNHMAIERIKEDRSVAPDYEQTGSILIESALVAIEGARNKIWENGKEEIGEIIPEEFEEVVGVYTMVIQQIAYEFVELLKERGL